jgi:hypothetical protein
VAEVYMPGLVRRPLKKQGSITAWVVRKRGRELSGFADFTVARLRKELESATARADWD